MAKQKSHIKYTGTLGEIRHFRIKGKEGFFAGLKGGVDRDVIYSDPKFARTRENMQEFAGAAKAGKALRLGFPQLMRQMGGPGYTGRLTGLMKRIMNGDTAGKRGERLISMVGHPHLVQGTDLKKELPFSNVCRFPLDLSVNTDRKEVTWSVEPFLPGDYISIPGGATHFRLILATATVSDFAFNNTVKQYTPVNPEFNGWKTQVDGGYLPVGDEVASALAITATLPIADPMPADVAVVTAVAIEFVQEVNGTMYLLSDGHAMQLAKVF